MIGNTYFDAILNKFKNGKERYNSSALFRNTIDHLVFTETTPEEVIDRLITIVENTQDEFKRYCESDVRPIILNGVIFENKSNNT